MAALHPASPRAASTCIVNSLTGKAWLYAEELEMDILATPGGVAYFLKWCRPGLPRAA